MSRYLSIATAISAGFLSFVTLSGCANFMDGQPVRRFQSAWNDQDLSRLRNQSSERFRRTALSQRDSENDKKIQSDLKQLGLPDLKLSVVHVEKVEDGRKKVRVKADGSKREMQYIFVKNKKSGKWVVDDILMQQRRSRGLKVVRSVSEQMNLLQSVRDFRVAWDQGNRQQKLVQLAPELRDNISSLPHGYFLKLSQDISQKMKMKKSADRKPKAELNGDDAIVSIRGAKGKVRLLMKKDQDVWQIEDFAIEGNNRDEHIPSVKKLAQVLTTSINFLDAYAGNDLKTLELTSHRDLYKGGLSFGDLNSFILPTSGEAQNDYDVILKKHRAEFVINTKNTVVKLSLLKEIAPDESAEIKNFVISDVTIYDRLTNQKTDLTSAFMGQAIVETFWKKLATKNVRQLKLVSTKDFNNRVWNDIDQILFRQLPFVTAFSNAPKIVSTDHQGVVSRIHVLQNDRPLTYVLRKEGGTILVDDIESSKQGFEKSMKSVMQAMIPVRKFAAGVVARNPEILQKVSSKDFNGLIWNHVKEIPPSAFYIPKHTQAPLTSIRKKGDDIIVTLGDKQWGARIALVEEFGKYLIDDMQLILGPQPEDRLVVKNALRREVSNGIRTMAESQQPSRQTAQRNTIPSKPREFPLNVNTREFSSRNGSMTKDSDQAIRFNPGTYSPSKNRVTQTGYDQTQPKRSTSFQSNSRPTQQPETTFPRTDNLSTPNSESMLPDRNAFGMNRRARVQPQQQPAMAEPTQSGQIPATLGNPFDPTSSKVNKFPEMPRRERATQPRLMPSPNSTSSPDNSKVNPKIPLWDTFPDKSSTGKSHNENRSGNDWSKWESQRTDQATSLQNRRMTTPARTAFGNRQELKELQNIPLNDALKMPQRSGTGSGQSELRLAPGISSRKPLSTPAMNPPAENPFQQQEGSGSRR